MSDPEGSASDNTPLTSLAQLDESWSVACEGVVGVPCTAKASWLFLQNDGCCSQFPRSWLACEHHARFLMTLSVGHCTYCGTQFSPGATAYQRMERLNPPAGE